MSEVFKAKFEALCKELNIESAYVSFVQRKGPPNYDPPFPPKNEYDYYHGHYFDDDLQGCLERLDDEKPDGYKYVLAADAWRLLEHATTMQAIMKPAMTNMALDFQALQNLEGMMKDRLGIYRSRMVPLKKDTPYHIETTEGAFLMSYNDEFAWNVKKIEGDTPGEEVPMGGLYFMGCIVPNPENPDEGEILNLDGMPIVSLGCKMLWGRPEQIGQFTQMRPAWHTGPVNSLVEQFERQ